MGSPNGLSNPGFLLLDKQDYRLLINSAVLFKFTIRLRRLGQCDKKALKDKTIFTEKRSCISRRSH